MADELAPLKIRAVYQISPSVKEAIKAKFPDARFFSAATPFLAGCYQSMPEGEKEAAFACFQKKFFQLALLNQSGLVFYNRFSYQSANDALYFILLAYEQHGFGPSEVPLFLSGHILNSSEIYKSLYRYIAGLDFLPAPSFVQFGKNKLPFDPNFFFPLHSLLLCK